MFQTDWVEKEKSQQWAWDWLKTTQRWYEGEKTGTGDLARYFLLLWGNILTSSHSTHQQLWIFFQWDHVTGKAWGNWQLLGLLSCFAIYIYFVISIRNFLGFSFFYLYILLYILLLPSPVSWHKPQQEQSHEIIAIGSTWITKSNEVKERTYFRGHWICARACKFNCPRCKVYGIFWNGRYFINSHYIKVFIFLLWWHHHTHKVS